MSLTFVTLHRGSRRTQRSRSMYRKFIIACSTESRRAPISIVLFPCRRSMKLLHLTEKLSLRRNTKRQHVPPPVQTPKSGHGIWYGGVASLLWPPRLRCFFLSCILLCSRFLLLRNTVRPFGRFPNSSTLRVISYRI